MTSNKVNVAVGDGKQIKNDLEMKISRKRMKDFLDRTLFIIFVPFQTGAEMIEL